MKLAKSVPVFAALLLLFSAACNSQANKEEHEYTNALINSSSPYLLQHAHNPVNWYPWGEEALEKAKAENKLLIISVGYSACHWCHVMEHESFEDTTVAQLMNANFVSIKVDREERPDIDQIYMNAAYLISGRGGWPLNAIALPDGRPIFAATYFPREDWVKLLQQIAELYATRPEALQGNAAQLTEAIRKISEQEGNSAGGSLSPEVLDTLYRSIIVPADFRLGGRKGAPKFPMPDIYRFLLRHHILTGETQGLKATEITLDAMAAGGIYDQIGGGFARYSTDERWFAPHFEKMLYDNAQLVSLYSEAWQLMHKPRYKQVVFETLDFVERELTSPEGGFYSSLDADSEGEEGKFYVWTEKEIHKYLDKDSEAFKAFKDLYGVRPAGNWEEKNNILYRAMSDSAVIARYGYSEERFAEFVAATRDQLFYARAKRVRPGLDDKVLTGWNALMLKGYAEAYRVFGEQRFLDVAIKNARFLEKEMIKKDHRLNRNYKDGKSSINAFADDYGLLIEAYVALYQATFDAHWLEQAEGLMEYSMAHFWDEEKGLFYYSSDLDDALLTRPMQLQDNVIASANSSLAKGLIALGSYLYKPDYLDRGRAMVDQILPQHVENGSYMSNWGMAGLMLLYPPYEVAVVGPDWQDRMKELDQNFLPQVFFLGGAKEGKLELLENKLVKGRTMIYVCQDKVCKLPTEEVEVALQLIE